MTKRMLIDAGHAEETRVVVLDGNRLEDFDVETATKRQLKGNIYLAKVVRVEPSLQAAFVEYGGNRHGFLAFSEIHPDYYQIPVADRQRLLEMEAEEARREEEEADLEMALGQADAAQPAADEPPAEAAAHDVPVSAAPADAPNEIVPAANALPAGVAPTDTPASDASTRDAPARDPSNDDAPTNIAPDGGASPTAQPLAIEPDVLSGPVEAAAAPDDALSEAPRPAEHTADAAPVPAEQSPREDEQDDEDDGSDHRDSIPPSPPPETVGGDSDGHDERSERRSPSRFLRNYKIQEVIRRRQILLIQVVKEERGTKGAALTTYLSLAGRFSVLMPNSPRGGGISRKITSATDRRRLKEVMTELDIPRGMGLIVRTAGANRPKPEIKRDCEYLLRLWDDIREHTMKSVAPALIYEEASLIKRAIRDVYSRDVDDILVDGEDGWRAAHDFMRMLMPSHAKKVQLWRDSMPLFARHQVEAQLDAMLLPTVQLRSGGYLVINQAEALVAIDVNSGRSTRERGIEETALRTNLEAADEVARQLRLRDLAGLIVIDFIDMEAKKHNAMVERRLKEALKNDRARIQIGHISHFGLMEMSRQRLRPSLAETSFIACPHCGGTGHVRSTESAAIHVLRGIEDEGGKHRAAEIVVHVATPIALYLLNHKRERLQEIESRYAMRVIVAADDAQFASQYRIERVRAQIAGEVLPVVTPDAPQPALPPPAAAVAEAETDEDETTSEDEEEDAEEARAEGGEAADGKETPEEAERRRKRRRRRRRGRRDEAPAPTAGETAPVEVGEPAPAGEPASGEPALGEPALGEPALAAEGDGGSRADAIAAETHIEGVPEHAEPLASDEEARNRRRGRRGGRRRRREPGDGDLTGVAEPGAEQPDLLPIYAGPTPANPFGGQAFDIFDVLEQAERTATAPQRTVTPEQGVTGARDSVPPSPASTPVEVRAEPTAPAVSGSAAALHDPAFEALEPIRGAEADATADAAPIAEAVPAAEAPSAVEAASMVPTAEATASAGTHEADSVSAAEPGAGTFGHGVPEPAGAESPEAQRAAVEGTNVKLIVQPAADTGASVPAAEPPDTQPEAAEGTNVTVSVEPVADVGTSVPATEPPVAANDATSEAVIKPVVIGSTDVPPVEKKRGWWRR